MHINLSSSYWKCILCGFCVFLEIMSFVLCCGGTLKITEFTQLIIQIKMKLNVNWSCSLIFDHIIFNVGIFKPSQPWHCPWCWKHSTLFGVPSLTEDLFLYIWHELMILWYTVPLGVITSRCGRWSLFHSSPLGTCVVMLSWLEHFSIVNLPPHFGGLVM